MIRQPAAQAKKAADLQNRRKKRQLPPPRKSLQPQFLQLGITWFSQVFLHPGQSETGAWNYDSVYANLKSDIQVCRHCYGQSGNTFHHRPQRSQRYRALRHSTEVGDALVNAGFNVVTSATALIDDNGSSMINETLNYWETSHPDVTLVGIHKSQTSTNTAKIVEINGIKIAFLDYTFPAYGSQSGISDSSDTSGNSTGSDSSTDGTNRSASDNSAGGTDGSTDGTDSSASANSADTTGNSASSGSAATSSSSKGSMIDTFNTADVAAAIKQAKASADCVIFSAKLGQDRRTNAYRIRKRMGQLPYGAGC